ncbi:MAG TPA: sugar ABC transporter permease [Lentisphaeria bacterium]|nr:MAG: sugar ABC transporter permease [Lentisphaerae bacterium GWF2_50_93]HCE45164.1 sugar ABC transporter permease [Lentisphaeria bacterium]
MEEKQKIFRDNIFKRLFWPLMALGLLLLFNLIFTKGFFHIEMRDGHFYGTLLDILNHGSKVMILAVGMTLVIATKGVDLSVGAVMAVAGAIAALLIVQVESGWIFVQGCTLGGLVPFLNAHHMSWFLPALAAIMISLVAGLWNALLVAGFRIQPIVATLVLMVAGRGIAQLITDGQIITFTNRGLTFIGNGHFLFLPFSVWIALGVFAIVAIAVRKTALGLFIESVGNNETASFYAGIEAKTIKGFTYVVCGLCAGVAGLIAASNIKCADSNNAGLYLELDAILAVVIGGTSLNGGRFFLAGSIVGAILIQTLTTTMYARDVSPHVAAVPKALVIIIVCLLQSETFRRKAMGILKTFKNK